MRRGSLLAYRVAVLAVLFGFSSICASSPLMVDKNLFSQDRKPPSPDQAPAPQQSNTPGLSPKALQLDGVFIFGNTKKALLRIKGQIPGKTKDPKAGPHSPYVTVREGEKVSDYQVVKIEPKSVSLEKEGQVFVLNLFAEGKIVPPPPPVPASASSPPQHPGQAAGQPPEMPGGAPGQHRATQGREPGFRPGAGVANVAPPPQMGHPPGDVGADVSDEELETEEIIEDDVPEESNP